MNSNFTTAWGTLDQLWSMPLWLEQGGQKIKQLTDGNGALLSGSLFNECSYFFMLSSWAHERSSFHNESGWLLMAREIMGTKTMFPRLCSAVCVIRRERLHRNQTDRQTFELY